VFARFHRDGRLRGSRAASPATSELDRPLAIRGTRVRPPRRAQIGGSSQVVERRAGSWNGTNFVEHPGGSLIQDRSLYPSLQERVLPGNNVIAFRASLSILGLGFVEAIDSNTIAAIAQSQSLSVRGQVIQVPVFEAGGATRVGRFGWKNQQASLLSFSADAYSNEMASRPRCCRSSS